MAELLKVYEPNENAQFTEQIYAFIYGALRRRKFSFHNKTNLMSWSFKLTIFRKKLIFTGPVN